MLENHQRLVFTASSNRRASCNSGREGDTVAVYDRVAWRQLKKLDGRFDVFDMYDPGM